MQPYHGESDNGDKVIMAIFVVCVCVCGGNSHCRECDGQVHTERDNGGCLSSPPGVTYLDKRLGVR